MADGLDVYNQKRDFHSTPEPEGKIKRSAGSAYIIQKHAARRLHFDFRLELDGVLLSWAVTKGPSLDPSVKRLAVRTEDHPVSYADFEGVIPDGYGAGTVMLWDRGSWTPRGDPREGLREGQLKFDLEGDRLKGGFALIRLKGSGEKRENWLLIKERDAFAVDGGDATKRWKVSVKSGKSLEAIAKIDKAPNARRGKRSKGRARIAKAEPCQPTFTQPQLATLADAPPDGDGWLHEVKFDGYRIIAVIRKGKARLYTRNRKDWTHKYTAIAEALETIGIQDAVVDGELVALDHDGRTDFSLMSAAPDDPSIPLNYYVFDVLNLDGADVTALPLIERKRRLQDLMAEAPDALIYTDHIEGDGAAVITAACRMDLEGIISKQADAPYRSGRSRNWIKSKCVGSDEFLICGYRKSDKRGRAFASLLLGEYENGTLSYRGRVGTGFDEEAFGELQRKFASRRRKTSPFDHTPAEALDGAVWLRPDLVAQVGYIERTKDGRLRHPTFLGLRSDKDAADMKREARRSERNIQADTIAEVKLTSPDKVLWPDQGVTKRALAEYLSGNAHRLLPHIRDRPVSLVRCPQGRQNKCFFQRHHNASSPDELGSVEIREKDGTTSPYLVIDSETGLAAAAQIGALELHVWGARRDMIERPERLVMDLDPDEALDFEAVRDAAFEVRDVLAALGLESFPLLTGGKGVHVVAPLVRRSTWDEVKAFSRGVARKLEAAAPDNYIAQASKQKRKGRIFIDWLRNERGATAIAPYSTRARAGCPIATPVSWRELKTIDTAAAYTIATVARRLASLRTDPWDGYDRLRQSVTKAMQEAVAD